jgi:hypothetical protein
VEAQLIEAEGVAAEVAGVALFRVEPVEQKEEAVSKVERIGGARTDAHGGSG